MDVNQITFRSTPVTLVKDPLAVGDEAPDFTALSAGGDLLRWSDENRGRVSIVGSLPSILLPECAAQIRVLDQDMPSLSGNDQIPLWLVTSDSPATLRDFIDEFDITHVLLLSDGDRGDFARHYGVALEETELLARSLFTIGRDQTILYREIHPEIIEDPQYYRAFKAAFSHLH